MCGLVETADVDVAEDRAKAEHGTDDPTPEQREAAQETLAREACSPFDDPDFRDALLDANRRRHEVIEAGAGGGREL